MYLQSVQLANSYPDDFTDSYFDSNDSQMTEILVYSGIHRHFIHISCPKVLKVFFKFIFYP